jgi:hypothetical protein
MRRTAVAEDLAELPVEGDGLPVEGDAIPLRR